MTTTPKDVFLFVPNLIGELFLLVINTRKKYIFVNKRNKGWALITQQP